LRNEPEKSLSWHQEMLLRKIERAFGDDRAEVPPLPEPREEDRPEESPPSPAVVIPAPVVTKRRWLRMPSRKVLYWSAFAALGLIIIGFVLLKFLPGYNMYVVQSGSMEPALSVGDMIVTGPVGGWLTGDVATGSIVTYNNSHKSVTHRVVAVDGDSLITKGDASEDPDTFAVSLGDVEGILLFSVPKFGHVVDFIGTKQGWFFVIILPASLLVFMLVREIVKEALRKDGDKAHQRGRCRISKQSKKHAGPA
jgi:signal peptidase I